MTMCTMLSVQRWTVVLGTVVTSCALTAAEPEPPAAVSFFKDVRPILQAHCHGCHQPAKPNGEYVMTDFARLVAGGESETAAIVPGDATQGVLLEQIRPVAGAAAMPKDRPPLSAADIALIERWVRQGAQDDSPQSTRIQYDAQHPPVYSAAPVITSLDYSPDGSLLAVSGYHEVLLHRADGTGIAQRLVGLSERIESAEFSPDGARLAVTGGSPGRLGELQIWSVADGQLLRSLQVGYDTLYGASWSSDGKLVAFGCPDNTVRAIETEAGQQVLFSGAHEGWVLDTVFSVTSEHLVSVSRDMSMKLTHVPTQRFVDNITSITPGALRGGLNAVDRHPTKDEVVTGGADGTPRIYRMYREKARQIGDDFNLIRAFAAMPGRVMDVSFSADGSQIAASSSFNGAGEVRVFRVEDGAEICRTIVADGGVYAVAFRPDGSQVAAAGFDGHVRLIDARQGTVIQQFLPVEIANQRVSVNAR